MNRTERALVVAMFVVPNLALFAFVWKVVGSWLVPWLLVFLWGPLFGAVVWMLAR